ncbi:MAG TPA: serine hydrolase [Gemmatimonadales bacterium]|nr:serine hydrolase [Gemmatimonadales bacterium]
MRARLAVILACAGSTAPAVAQFPAPPPRDLSGLWSATLRFGPDVRGTLILVRDADGWRADIAGFAVAARGDSQAIAFELPEEKGSFRGRLAGREIHGHWIQPRTQHSGLRYATPVTLEPVGPGRWRGTVTPLEDRLTFYLPLTPDSGGAYRTYLRNPERNIGRFFAVSRVERRGDSVRLMGDLGEGDRVLSHGTYEEDGIRGVRLRGGAYDFARVPDSSGPGFHPRGKPAPRYRYAPPLAIDDGWPVGSLEAAGISRDAIERFIQLLIDQPQDSLGSPQVHSVLIARHGRLVVEEYFHGTHRDQPHDLRSASKSHVAVLIGAAMAAGIPIRLDTPVYATMLGRLPDGLDPRARAMTLEHLISMTAGYQCGSDLAAPHTADEDVMQQSGERDFYRYTLAVPLVSAPGEKLFYCSAEPNLAGGMLERIAGEPQVELFDRLVARPLQMRRYHLMLQPTGEAYGGGGHQFVPRDFLKLAQLMLDGRWGDRRVLSRDWVTRSRAPLRDLSRTQQYGWLWNSAEYTIGDRKVRGYFAGGNGGQVSMAFPDLDLVIAFTGGSYSMPSLFIAQRVYVSQYLLPAVRP